MARYNLDWSFGLIASHGGYLNVEPFQDKLDSSGSKLKKKQILFLEQGGSEGTVVLRTHVGKYLRVDGDGKFLADGTRDDNMDEIEIVIEAQPDGRWLLKSKAYNWYLRAESAHSMSAFVAEPTEDAHWKVHLAMHPQITLKNEKRRRFVIEDKGQLNTSADQPFGTECTLNLVHDNGTYALQSASSQAFLQADGRMVDDRTEDCQFIIEFAGDQIAFKSKKAGKYLTSLGGSGLLKATKPNITADEKWRMEDSWPQVTLKNVKNDKFVSYMGNTDMSANKDEPTYYQMESQDDGTWVFKTEQDFFIGAIDGSLQNKAGAALEDPKEHNKFTVEFGTDNKIRFKSAGGKYIQAKMNKQLVEGSAEPSDDGADEFYMEIINRPTIALRGKYGFVGQSGSSLLRCNHSAPTFFNMKAVAGGYQLDGWAAADNQITCSGGSDTYQIELFKESKMAIKHNGNYLKAQQTGEMTFTGAAVEEATLWEY